MRQFPDIVRDLAGGAIMDLAGSKLAEVVGAVMKTGKAGSLKLELEIKSNGEVSVRAKGKVTAKVPEADIGDTIFFAKKDESGAVVNLTRDDPRQQRLPLRDISEPAGADGARKQLVEA